MNYQYIVEKDRQPNGMDYQVVSKNDRRGFREVICACYYEHEAQMIAEALNNKQVKS